MQESSPSLASPERQAFAAAEQRLWNAYDLDIEERYITLSDPDIRLRTLTAGEGDPLLFVHGGGSYASTFVPLVAQLTDYRCILFDRPACGLSDGFDYRGVDLWVHATEVLLGVLDELGLDRVPIVGHSMGGNWALWLAGRRPERVESVVLQGAVGHLLDMKMAVWQRAGSLPRKLLSSLGTSPFQALLTIENRLFPSSLDSKYGQIEYRALGHEKEVVDRLPDALFELDRRHMVIPSVIQNMGDFIHTIGGIRGARPGLQITASELADFETPTRFIWGENDVIYGPEYGQRAAEIMPNADAIVIPGGHDLWLDDPEQCAQLTRDFVEQN